MWFSNPKLLLVYMILHYVVMNEPFIHLRSEARSEFVSPYVYFSMDSE